MDDLPADAVRIGEGNRKAAKGGGRAEPRGKGNRKGEAAKGGAEGKGKAAKGGAEGKGNTDDETYSDEEETNSDEEEERGQYGHFHGNYRLAITPYELELTAQRMAESRARARQLLEVANNARARLALEFEVDLMAQREEEQRVEALRRNGPWAFARRAWVRRNDEAQRRASPYFTFPEFPPDLS
jgi:DNA mismatch repair ATPase MutL